MTTALAVLLWVLEVALRVIICAALVTLGVVAWAALAPVVRDRGESRG